MRIRFAATVLATTALAAATLATTPAQAAHQGGIHIGLVQFDSPGKDTRSNTSLNAEWVNLHNNSRSALQLKGYKLKDNTGYTYTFGSYRIGAGKTVKVRTGKGKNIPGTVYWNRGSYVWNNTGDKARLLTAKGALRDSCSWGTAKSGQKNCH